MALRKHRVTTASIPDGLMSSKVELTKGMIVARELVDGKYEITLSKDGSAYGFVTLREDEAVYKESYYDVIPAGKKAVVYTLVKDNEWRTDQFVEGLKVGDKCIAGTDGKVTKVQDSKTPILEVIGVSKAMAGYEKPMVTVKVL